MCLCLLLHLCQRRRLNLLFFYFSHSRSLYEFHCYLASHATGKKFKNSNFYLSLKCDPVISPVSKKVFKKVVPFYFWSLVFKHYVQTTLRKSIPKGTTFSYYRIFALRFRILYFSIFIDTLARKIAGYSRCVATTKTFFPSSLVLFSTFFFGKVLPATAQKSLSSSSSGEEARIMDEFCSGSHRSERSHCNYYSRPKG